MTHSITAKPINVSAILGGDIRLEASTYLREGYGLVRLANRAPGRLLLGDLADIWQPTRLAGYTVPEGKGLPFLTAGQVFEDFPRVRKWLARPFVPQADERYVDQSWLLLTCSGVVGNVTAVYPHHLGKIISHDLLRIVPNDSADYGWLYAYMKTDFFMKIARAAQYGHMIKHIEVAHTKEFPIIMPSHSVRKSIGDLASKAISLRTEAWNLRNAAFSLLERYIGVNESINKINKYSQCSVSVSKVLSSRSRLDADTYAGQISLIDDIINNSQWNYLIDLIVDVYELPRFKRFYGDSDVPFVGISELFDVNARPTKHIYAKLVRNWERYILHAGNLVMACSGQKYGILGRTLMLTENHEGMFGSNHLLRITPDNEKLPSGYLLAFLNDPLIGRPTVVRNAYGTSVPQFSPMDIKEIHIPRIGTNNESSVSEVMCKSVEASAKADRLEHDAIRLAQEQIDLSIAEVSTGV